MHDVAPCLDMCFFTCDRVRQKRKKLTEQAAKFTPHIIIGQSHFGAGCYFTTEKKTKVVFSQGGNGSHRNVPLLHVSSQGNENHQHVPLLHVFSQGNGSHRHVPLLHVSSQGNGIHQHVPLLHVSSRSNGRWKSSACPSSACVFPLLFISLLQPASVDISPPW